MAKGKKTGGRKKGSLNKRMGARLACEKYGVNPFEYMAMVVKGDVPCNVCRQRGKTRVKASAHAGEHSRNCQSCKGDGWEKLSPDTRLKAAMDMSHYLEPKLQNTTHTGADGGPIQVQILDKLNAGRARVAALREGKA